jgi:uncharacterized membrane protein YadS
MNHPAGGSRQRPPGPLPGAAVGVGAGLVLSAIWAYGAWDVALALTTVFLALVIAVVLGARAWRPFALAMLTAAAATGGTIAILAG